LSIFNLETVIPEKNLRYYKKIRYKIEGKLYQNIENNLYIYYFI